MPGAAVLQSWGLGAVRGGQRRGAFCPPPPHLFREEQNGTFGEPGVAGADQEPVPPGDCEWGTAPLSSGPPWSQSGTLSRCSSRLGDLLPKV